MKKDKNRLSKGEVLHKVAKTSTLKMKEIAEKAGYKAPTFYVHLKNADLPYETLARYGKVLGHDFSNEFPEMSEYIFHDEQTTYNKKKLSYEELVIEKERWQAKYQDLSEKYQVLADKYQVLLEEKLGL